jgi:benzoylformate decarboxylase
MASFADLPKAPGSAGVQDVAEAVAASVGADTTVVLDATTSTPQLLRYLPHQAPDQLYTSASGSLGWGMGAALGLQLARPERDVVAVVGDGVFQFGIQALWAAKRYDLPVTFVVINNQAYAAVGAALSRYRGHGADPTDLPCTDIAGVEIAETARAFGLNAERVSQAGEIGPALDRCRKASGASVLEVMTDPRDLGPAAVRGVV